MKAIDLTGMKFGRLTVIERRGQNKLRHAVWLCRCECGNEKLISSKDLKEKNTNSCGCLRREIAKESNTTHGKTGSRLYAVWRNIIRRCCKETATEYKYYGGRGIKVCEEWKNDFQAFYDWAMGNGYDENAPRGRCTIDRIDVNGNYEPLNCRWIPTSEQNKKRRCCKKYKES